MSAEDLYTEYLTIKKRLIELESLLEDIDIDNICDPSRIPDPPKDVVSRYTKFILTHIDAPDSFVTEDIVAKHMTNYIRELNVMAMDYIEKGWKKHMLFDTNPRVGICETIQEEYEDNYL